MFRFSFYRAIPFVEGFQKPKVVALVGPPLWAALEGDYVGAKAMLIDPLYDVANPALVEIVGVRNTDPVQRWFLFFVFHFRLVYSCECSP